MDITDMSIIYDFKAINDAANKISRHMLWPDEKIELKNLPPHRPLLMAVREDNIAELVRRIKERLRIELALYPSRKWGE